eukprot:6318624-Amphidinium_carterae.1
MSPDHAEPNLAENCCSDCSVNGLISTKTHKYMHLRVLVVHLSCARLKIQTWSSQGTLCRLEGASTSLYCHLPQALGGGGAIMARRKQWKPAWIAGVVRV